MDPERIRRAALGRRGAMDARAARRRLLVYSAALGLVALWYVFNPAASRPPPVADQPMEFVEGPAVAPPLARVDPALLATVRDDSDLDRATLEPAARDHLLHQARKLVYGDLAQLGLQPGEREALVTTPARYRGDVVYVIGTLAWFERVPGSAPAFYRGELDDEQGLGWTFLVAVEPFDVRPGDVVKAQGFFLKHHDMLRPDRSFASGPLIVGEELLASSFRIDPVHELRAGLFDDLVDHGLEEASRPLDSPVFYEALSYVHHTDAARLFGAATPPEVRARQLLAEGDGWRGRPVKVFGQLLYKRRVPLGPRGENPLGIPFAWELWVQFHSETTLVVMLEEPAGLEVEQIVEVEGLYLRRLAYENRRNEPRLAAVVLGKRARRFVPEPDELTPAMVKIILGLVGLCGVLLGWGAWRDRRSAASGRAQRVRRSRKLLRLPGRLSTGPGPDTPAPGADPDGS